MVNTIHYTNYKTTGTELIDVTDPDFQEEELLDKREHCFCLQSSSGGSHYLGVGEFFGIQTAIDLTEDMQLSLNT